MCVLVCVNVCVRVCTCVCVCAASQTHWNSCFYFFASTGNKLKTFSSPDVQLNDPETLLELNMPQHTHTHTHTYMQTHTHTYTCTHTHTHTYTHACTNTNTHTHTRMGEHAFLPTLISCSFMKVEMGAVPLHHRGGRSLSGLEVLKFPPPHLNEVLSGQLAHTQHNAAHTCAWTRPHTHAVYIYICVCVCVCVSTHTYAQSDSHC